MRKTVTAGAAFILVLALFFSASMFAFQGPASIPPPDAALNATSEILDKVSKIRGLDVKSRVKSGLKTKDEIERAVMKDLDESTTPEEFAASQKMLTRLGLLKKDFQLRDYIVKLLREQVAGFYDPKTREFYMSAWVPIPEQKMVMAHELMHALQDQHFNLRRFENWPKGDSDAELAVRALIEGEAMLIMYQYAFEQEGVRFDVTKIPSLTERMLAEAGADDASKYPVLANAPAVLRDGLQFPYVYGAGFVQQVLKNGSWKAVGESYDKLPASSEQIMHPERFVQRDNPIKVDIASLDETLGSEWKRVDADVTGEFGYLIALREFIGKSAAKAAAGWGGDGYLLFEHKKTGATLLVQYTAWDNIAEAREFFDAYGLRTEKRYNQKLSDASPPPSRVYETTEGIASIEMRGADVVIIEGAEDRKQLARIVERLWKSKKTERARVNLPTPPSGNAN